MRDIVLVPVFYRPDYLQLCLERILASEGGKDKDVWICQDRHPGYHPNAHELILVKSVAESFKTKFHQLYYQERKINSYQGNTYNLMEMYKEAFLTDARFVYLVEEDVLVAPDFFKWHEAVQAQGDYLMSCGWKCIRNPKAVKDGAPEDFIETTRDYASIGVCWKRENLEVLIKHAVEPYYRNQIAYLKEHFATNRIPPNQWTEQDGVIMRILMGTPDKYKVAWPVLPRCQHIGIWGYHRPGGAKFQGTLQARVSRLAAMAANVEEMKRISKDPYKDVMGQPEIGPWSELRVVQKLVYDGAI